ILEARQSGPTRATSDVCHYGHGHPLGVGGERRHCGASRHPSPTVSRSHDGDRRGTRAHIVLGNAARHRLFLVDAGIHRVLHAAPAGGRRSTLQRHHGPAHVHHVYHILGASRNASPLRRSGAWRGNEVFAVVPDLLCRPADAADGLLDLRQPGNSRTCTRRKRPPGLDSGIAVGRANGARNRAVAGDARPRRIRRAHQHGLRHELHDPQYVMGDGAFPYDFRRRRRDHVFRYRLRDVAAHHGKAAAVQGLGALAALAVVRWHDDRLDPMAHHWLDGPAASRRRVRLQRSVRRSHGPAGHHFGYWRRDPTRVCHSTDRHSGALSVGRKTARGTAALCPRGKSAQNGPRSLERLRAVERDPARPDGVRLRISHWSVLYSEIESSRLRSVRPHEQRGGALMARDQGAFRLHNPWPKIAWGMVALLVVVSTVLGFGVLSRYQQNGPTLDLWNAICRGLGLSADTAPAKEPVPTLRTPTRIAWTSNTLDQIAAGDAQRGAFIAINCVACHGQGGVSTSTLIPTLAGMDPAVIYKQLDDYRSGKRLWGVMGAI